MNNLSFRVKNKIAAGIVKSKRYDPTAHHLIFSDPRGGSSWLMEIIQHITAEPVVWEPLFIGYDSHPFKQINFGWRQYIPRDEEWKAAKDQFDRLFGGEILVNNILYKSTFEQVVKSKSLLFKFCRGNALLPWLTENYNFQHKPIYLIRHPFAVVSSQLRHSGWDYSFSGFNIPDQPFTDHYLQHKDFLKTITTKEEIMVAEWCLTNSVVLSDKNNNKSWLTMNYEEFVMNPEQSLSRILTSWGIEFDLSSINFTKNSSTTKADSPDQVVERLWNWQHKLNKPQLERMGRVLDYFNIEVYSKDEVMPARIFNYGAVQG